MATADDITNDIKIAVSVLSLLYSLGKDEGPAIAALLQTVFLGKPLTDDQRAALGANHLALTNSLQQPIPDVPANPS